MSQPPASGGSELRQRAERSIAALNAGDPEPMLQGYAEDVVVLTPVFRLGEPVGQSEIRGKAAFRAYLLNYRDLYQGFSVVDAFPNERGFVLMLETGARTTITVSIEVNDKGLGQRVLFFHT